MPLLHHELCFGCGRTNLFGLLLELEGEPGQEHQPGSVSGRGFIKQDHQGPVRGQAHEGILCAAVAEAMSLASGFGVTPRSITVDLLEAAPVGTFLDVQARAEVIGGSIEAQAEASSEGVAVARGRGTYRAG